MVSHFAPEEPSGGGARQIIAGVTCANRVGYASLDGDPGRITMLVRRLVVVLASLLVTTPGFAQTPALTADDYARAEKFMGYNTNRLVFRAGIRPTWLPDGRFWYRVTTDNGVEFVLVDPAVGTRTPAFDHAKLAAALSTAAGTTYSASRLPFQQFDLAANEGSLSF